MGMAVCLNVGLGCGVWFSFSNGAVPIYGLVPVSLSFRDVVADELVAPSAIAVFDANIFSSDLVFLGGGGGQEEFSSEREDAVCECEGKVVVCQIEEARIDAGGGESVGSFGERLRGGIRGEEGGDVDCGEWGGHCW